MSQRFSDPKIIVTSRWRRRPVKEWSYVEYMYEDLAQYFDCRRQYDDDDYEHVIVNTRQVTGCIASEIAEMNEDYQDSMPMELFTST